MSPIFSWWVSTIETGLNLRDPRSMVHNVLPFSFLQRETAGTLCSTSLHVDLKPSLKQASWHEHAIYGTFTQIKCLDTSALDFMLWNYMNPNLNKAHNLKWKICKVYNLRGKKGYSIQIDRGNMDI